jgi:DNA sulfur modification protein DndE
MGEVGSGKTRTARSLIEQIRAIAPTPVLAFDLKGDLRDDRRLIEGSSCSVISTPEMAIPLDVLSIDTTTSTDFNVAAERFRESVGRITPGKFGAVQLDALREAALRAFRNRRPTLLTDVRDMLLQVYEEKGKPADGLTATFNELCSYTLFEPRMKPEEFFSQNWILTFPRASDQVRRMVCYLILDALDRWLNSLGDAPTDASGNRALRHVVMIDEAHRVLGEKQPALVNLVRMSRSKGGVVMLVSQSPDDFASEEEDFLANVGLCLCFRTKAKPGAVTRMLGQRVDLAGIADGVCVTRLKNRPGVVRIQCWSPQKPTAA